MDRTEKQILDEFVMWMLSNPLAGDISPQEAVQLYMQESRLKEVQRLNRIYRQIQWAGKGQHGPEDCAGQFCCIHNPSDHHMREWPMNLRMSGLTERICPHGVGHPDPDSMAWIRTRVAEADADALSIHGCDLCCRPPQEKESVDVNVES